MQRPAVTRPRGLPAPTPTRRPEASNPYLHKQIGLSARDIDQALASASSRERRSRELRRVVQAVGLSGVDLLKIPEDELRKRLGAMGHEPEVIAAVLEARRESSRIQALHGGRSGTWGSGFESPKSKGTSASSPKKPSAPTKPDTSYAAYRAWCRERGAPVSDGCPTETEYAAYNKWKQALESGADAGTK